MRRIMLCIAVVLGMTAARAQTTVLTEDFSAAGNIFGVSATEPATATYSTILDDTWKTADLNVVAFVYNDTDGVVQATTRAVQTTE